MVLVSCTAFELVRVFGTTARTDFTSGRSASSRTFAASAVTITPGTPFVVRETSLVEESVLLSWPTTWSVTLVVSLLVTLAACLACSLVAPWLVFSS